MDGVQNTIGMQGGEEPPERPRKGRAVTRRSFAALASVAALSMFLPASRAWAGVEGGGWGSIGATAYPGNHFGYDGGWGYSGNGKVWLSVSCNATVGRMTELLVQISVTSYYANGGVWSPTWFTDYADTHVDSFIRDSSGTWLSSASGFYDTTQDNSSYHGPYVTDTHIVRREAWDWWAWAGVRAWCDSNDSAYGINTTAEAHQLIPAHCLTDNRWWQNRIATLRPRNALHLYMDTTAAGGAGTGVCLWSGYEAANQNWIIANSAQGRTCFIPVHVGADAVFLDVAGGVWDDLAAMQVWTGNGGLAQSYYLHNLGAYHLIVPECSGCAVDSSGGTVDGTGVIQYNCFGNWSNYNQHWLLQEPVFHEVSYGSMALSGLGADGVAEAGAAVSAPNPQEPCRPCNWGATTGLFWRYTWYRSDGPFGRARVLGQATGLNLGADLGEQIASAYLGTMGIGIGLETVKLRIDGAEHPGAICYQTISQGAEWQDARAEGEVAGEAGNAIKQVKIWLEGEMADRYDVEYRLFGTTWDSGPCRNGEATPEPPGWSVEALYVKLLLKETGAVQVARAAGEDPSYIPVGDDEGKHLTCVVTAHTRYLNLQYLGSVALPSVPVREPYAEVRYCADKDAEPYYVEQARIGEPYHSHPDAARMSAKEYCERFVCWFTDPECAEGTGYAEGTVLEGELTLYGYNVVALEYATAQSAFIATTDKELFADEALSVPFDMDALYPSRTEYRYGETVTFAASAPAYYSDMGRTRTASRVPGVFASDPPTGTAMLSARLTRTTTVWCDWRAGAYDGVTLRQQ